MRTILFLAASGCACALMISGCAYEHPGPTLANADGSLPSSEPPTPAPEVLLTPSTPPKPKHPPTVSARASALAANNPPAAAPPPAPAKAPVIPLFPVWPEKTPAASAPEPDAATTNSTSSPDTAPGTNTAASTDTATNTANVSTPRNTDTANSSTPDSPGTVSDGGSGFDNLEVVDASLKGKLTVLRVGSEPTTNNLLSVFVGLKNKTAHQLDLEMQTIYKDKAGNELNSESWIPITLKPHEETEYRSASISSDATDFLIRIRSKTDDGPGEVN